jgi:hypothetical protein
MCDIRIVDFLDLPLPHGVHRDRILPQEFGGYMIVYVQILVLAYLENVVQGYLFF